jgi:hypothetical protein
MFKTLFKKLGFEQQIDNLPPEEKTSLCWK